MSDSAGFGFIVLTPPGFPDPSLAIAGSRAGAIGVLNLEHTDDHDAARCALRRMADLGRGRLGVLLGASDDSLLSAVLAMPLPGLETVILSGRPAGRLGPIVERLHREHRRALLVASTVDEALAGEAAGVDAVIAKGHEAGGWVAEETTFILLQRFSRCLKVPVWAYGGVGLHTAAACRVAGAAGAVLDGQLLLLRESPLPERVRARIRTMDGSETACLGADLGAAFRAYSRPDLPVARQIQRLEASAIGSDRPPEVVLHAWRSVLGRNVDWRQPEQSVLAIGQDAAFAPEFARRFGTVGLAIDGLRRAIREQCDHARGENPLAEGSPLARSHGTRYPIVQGPMTRVSDRAEFAAAVAEAGALPFLALALMRAPEVKALFAETRDRLGDRPWGAGILGFVPAELRAEQNELIRAYRPPFALIAGGRPDQARALEAEGIATYLHVPSPGLLRMFLQEDATRFVFEGRECGGHVGPRTSFVLWESMIDVLLGHVSAPRADPSRYHVLFAGGVHDGLSAAMVAAMAAPLARRGVRVGVLLGTAYLFTHEAVQSGAIIDGFQKAALSCRSTVLLESGPGHATRCVPSPFVADFGARKRELIQEGRSAEELRHRLEELNIGRLRVASKGVDREEPPPGAPPARTLRTVGDGEQWSRGMYMIGQVAAIREEPCSLAQLHEDISAGSARVLASPMPIVAAGEPPCPPPAAVAIVGMACILPGASDLKTYWSNILSKVDAITEVPPGRWDWRQYFDTDWGARDKIYSRWGGFIGDVPFDPAQFGMPPSSLPSIEPFQLLALSVVRSALEDAGYIDRPFPRSRTSVILGAGGGGADLTAGYMFRSSLPSFFGPGASAIADGLGPRLPAWSEDSFPGLLMNVAAGRVANRFDLGGVNYTVDAACASSLAAVYLAVRELEARTSDMVVVGGVDAIQNPFAFLCFSKTRALSPTGRCRTFDAQGDGIAISEGFAAVILKRLDDAERDGDRIYGVIRGIGGSSDGRDRSMTAPRPEGQVGALRRAYAHAGFSPTTVELVEAHGTGTVAGDQAEIQALTSFFGEAGAAQQGCAVGSVKSMIGHTKATAGVAGLIKVALSLRHKVLPPTIGVTQPNPKSNLPASPFYVNTEARPWIHPEGASPRRAGISAFGFGGTNFHVVAEEYTGSYLPDRASVVDPRSSELFLWRGARAEIVAAIDRVADDLGGGARPRLADLAYTTVLAAGPAAAEGPALAIVATSLEDLAGKLRSARDRLLQGSQRFHEAEGLHYAERPMAPQGRVAFLFPGQGSQYVDMARDVAMEFDEVRRCFERADRCLAGALARPLSRFIFPPPTFTPEDARRCQAELTETGIAQPALGATDVAFFHLLRGFGVEPQMTAGHSFGEFVALFAAGCYGEETLFQIAAARGRFIAEETTEDSGAMAAVDAVPDDLRPMLEEHGLTLANLNAPMQTVVSGRRSDIEKAVAWCGRRGLNARLLPVSCAFHSPMVAPAKRRLAEFLGHVSFARAGIPVFSNTTAGPYPDDPTAIADLLGNHLVRPVEFVREVEAMYRAGARLFVEVGPRNVLTGLVGRILGGSEHLAVPLDLPGRSSLVQLNHALAALVAEGVPVAAERLFGGRQVRRLDLRALAAETGVPRHTATTWLVNGGGARPAASLHGPGNRPASPLAITVSTSGTPVAGSQPAQPGDGQSPSGAPARSGGGPVRPTQPLPAGDSARSARREPLSHSRDGRRNGHHPANRSMAAVPGSHQQVTATNGGIMNQPTVESPRNDGVEAPANRVASYLLDHPSPPPPDPVPAGQGAADIVREFQQVMMRFLQTQENVMHDILAFVGTAAGGDGRPAPAGFGPRPVSAAANGTASASYAAPAEVAGPAPYPQFEPAEFTPLAPAEHTRRVEPPAPQPPPPPSPSPAAPDPAPARASATLADRPAPANMAVPAPPPEASPPARQRFAPPGRDQLTARLLAVVSERTGYPEEMLILDGDLEADLGIDSIKRVEIAGTVIRSLDLPDGHEPDIERLTSSRTLGQVIDNLMALVESAAATTANPDGPGGPRLPFDGARSGHGIGRFALTPTAVPSPDRSGELAPGGLVVIVDDETGVGTALAEHLRGRGRPIVRVLARPNPEVIDPECVALPRSEPGRLVELLHARSRTVAALVDLSALRPIDAGTEAFAHGWGSRPARDLEELFLAIQALRPDLEQSAAAGGAAVVAASALGGAFAVGGTGLPFHAWHGGVSGLLKSLAHEWPNVRVKAVDFSPAAPAAIAECLAAELYAADGVVEVGYRDGVRTALQLTRAPAAPDTGDSAVPIGPGSVVLITGGARGITAMAAHRLAVAARPTLVLVGRTPEPEGPEPPETSGLVEAHALKKAILEQLKRRGGPVTAAEVEGRYRRLLGEREVRDNLARLRGSGARVHYLSCDVRDPSAFGSLIDRVYSELGRIDGVIHGAGIIEDRLLKDKSLDSFRRVIETKVTGAMVLAAKLRPDHLRFVVLFSSVTGRFGNRGQADYAVASEVLNKLAQDLDRRWPARVVAINWGPWLQTGMVSPEVQRQFRERGVTLIPPEVGCRMLEEELRLGRSREAEVLIGGVADRAAHSPAADHPGRAPAGSEADLPPLLAAAGSISRREGAVEVIRPLDPEVDRYLSDHCIDGHPVLPFAMAMELIAETAEAGWPGMRVLELRKIRLMKGIVIDRGTSTVRIAARPRPDSTSANGRPHVERVIDVSIFSADDPGRARYRAEVVLGREPAAGTPGLAEFRRPLEGAGPMAMTVEDAYRDLLFHGPLFRGIRSIEAVGPDGASGLLARSSPGGCLSGRPAGRWLVDPVLIDSAFQMQVLWARLHWDVTQLPAGVDRYVRVAAPGTEETGSVRYELRVRPESQNPICRCDHFFHGPDGRVVAALLGVEGTGSKALNRLGGTCRC